jgi:ABC-type multidrug transport system permease subunit
MVAAWRAYTCEHTASKWSHFLCRRLTQYSVLFTRYLRSYWRSPPYNTTRLILATLAAFVLGTFFWSRGNNYQTTADITAVLGSLFMSIMFVGFINFQMIIPTFFMERPVMYRERAARMYAVLPWVQSMEDVEVPWIVLQARTILCRLQPHIWLRI